MKIFLPSFRLSFLPYSASCSSDHGENRKREGRKEGRKKGRKDGRMERTKESKGVKGGWKGRGEWL